MGSDLETDIVVVGGGPAGMAACLQSAAHGYAVAHVRPQASHVTDDGRTTAIMMPGVRMLENMELWERLSSNVAALSTLRIVDDTGRLLRAPTVDFPASDIGEEAFGYNFRNSDLNAALSHAVDTDERITLLDGMVSAAGFHEDHAVVTLSDGKTIKCKLVVGADGVQSVIRKAAGIEARQWSYPQTALVLTFSHTRPHHNVSTEFHTDRGPFTQVPLPGDNSSLVWVVKPEEADTYLSMDESDLSLEVERRMHSLLGKVGVTSRPQPWPLSGLVAHSFSARRAVLIGQAAHVFPPIGAQGLNLSFRDIADLSKAFMLADGDPGAARVTDAYDKMRKKDVTLRTAAVDLLNRSLLTSFLPVQMVRAAGLGVLKYVPSLRALAMREGMMPGSGLSRHSLMAKRG